MKNALALKIYDVDYSFIIRNYLEPELWQKTWTLFVYKNVRVTLELYQIDTRKPVSIRFKMRIQDENFSDYNYVTHDTENSNINVLKRQINGEIRDLINAMEYYYICQEDGYKEIYNLIDTERDELREIAEEYLNDNNITLDDVREAYIDKYVSDNQKAYQYRDNYVYGRKYKVLSNLWLVFYKAINNDEKYNMIVDSLKYDEDFEQKMQEVKEYVDILSNDNSEKYDNWRIDMSDCLEAI